MLGSISVTFGKEYRELLSNSGRGALIPCCAIGESR